MHGCHSVQHTAGQAEALLGSVETLLFNGTSAWKFYEKEQHEARRLALQLSGRSSDVADNEDDDDDNDASGGVAAIPSLLASRSSPRSSPSGVSGRVRRRDAQTAEAAGANSGDVLSVFDVLDSETVLQCVPPAWNFAPDAPGERESKHHPVPRLPTMPVLLGARMHARAHSHAQHACVYVPD